MYLISIYFDEETNSRIKIYMKSIAKATGNTAMLDGKVPPHVTIAAFRAQSEQIAREIFLKGAGFVAGESIQWISCGSFFPGVIYIAPLLNEYLHGLSEIYNKELKKAEEIHIDERYQPFHWFPHTTLGKHLTQEQLTEAFKAMQKSFGPFCGKVTKIGLAKTNPYTDLEVLKLK